MSCCNGNSLGRIIEDVDKLMDYLLADRGHIYRLPDKSMWVLNQANNGFDPFNEVHGLYTIKFLQKLTGTEIARGTVIGQKVETAGKTLMSIRGAILFDVNIHSITPSPTSFDVLLENVDTGTTITGFDGYISNGQNILQTINGGIAQINVKLNTNGKTGEYSITGFNNVTTGTVVAPISLSLI